MVPVVLFHAGIAFSGGFVGVDIFFVISGYLITGLIARQTIDQCFSFKDFYVRRICRLFPALWAVLAFTLIGGFFLLLPSEFSDLGVATQKVVLFLSNHLFWHMQNDYWAQNTLSTQPLLHTWSLAVEEQFYLVLPVLLAVLMRRGTVRPAQSSTHGGRHTFWTLLALAVVSFAASQWLLSRDAAGAFYILASRAWELLLGSLLALATLEGRTGQASTRTIDAVGIAGLTLIGWSSVYYTEKTPFPAAAALVPCIGTVLIIWAGIPRPASRPALVTRLLSWQPLVLIGLISYSLYLWHWPLLVFAQSAGWRAQGLPQIPMAVLLIAIAFVSYLSYRFIERPFRLRGHKVRRRWSAYSAALAALLVFVSVGRETVHIGKNKATIAQPIPDILRQLVHDTKTTPGAACETIASADVILRTGGGCTLGMPESADLALSFVLLGDSHARMWTAALDSIAKAQRRSGLALTRSSCTPLAGVIPPTHQACMEHTYASLDYVAQSPVRHVILSGYWTDLEETTREMVDQPGGVPYAADRATFFHTSLERTLHRLHAAGKQVYVMLDVPELANDDFPARAAVESIRKQATIYGPAEVTHRQRQAKIAQAFADLQEKYRFTLLDPAATLCSAAGCLVARDGRTLYRDKHHLNDAGALSLAAVFEPVFRNIADALP